MKLLLLLSPKCDILKRTFARQIGVIFNQLNQLAILYTA